MDSLKIWGTVLDYEHLEGVSEEVKLNVPKWLNEERAEAIKTEMKLR